MHPARRFRIESGTDQSWAESDASSGAKSPAYRAFRIFLWAAILLALAGAAVFLVAGIDSESACDAFLRSDIIKALRKRLEERG